MIFDSLLTIASQQGIKYNTWKHGSHLSCNLGHPKLHLQVSFVTLVIKNNDYKETKELN